MKKISDKKGEAGKKTKKLKIGFFCDAYTPIINGVTIAVNTYKKGLEAEGHKVYIIAPNYPGYRDKSKDIIRIPSVTLFSKSKYRAAIALTPKLSNIISELDIVHVHHPGPIGWAASVIARKKGKPCIFTHHTMYEIYWHYLPLPEKQGRKFIEFAISTFCRRFDFIILPSESVRENFCKRKVSRKTQIAVIPTGIELSRFRNADRMAMRRKHKIGSDEIVLIFLGRIAVEKNVLLMLRAFKKIIDYNDKLYLEKEKRIRLIVVGGGYDLQKCKNEAESFGIADDAVFTGNVKYDEVPKYFAASDIFLFPSVSETQGLVSIEAMAAGVPVIGMNATGTKDVVVDGRTGFLCRNNAADFAEKTKKLIYNDSLRERYSKNAAKEAEKYSIDVCTKKLLKFYSKAIDYYSDEKNSVRGVRKWMR